MLMITWMMIRSTRFLLRTTREPRGASAGRERRSPESVGVSRDDGLALGRTRDRRRVARRGPARPTDRPPRTPGTGCDDASQPRRRRKHGTTPAQLAVSHGLLNRVILQHTQPKLPRLRTSAEARKRESDILIHLTQLRTLATRIVGPAAAEQPIDRSVHPRRPRSGWQGSCGRTHVITS